MIIYPEDLDYDTIMYIRDWCDDLKYPLIVMNGLIAFVNHNVRCGMDITPESISKCLKINYMIDAPEDKLNEFALYFELI